MNSDGESKLSRLLLNASKILTACVFKGSLVGIIYGTSAIRGRIYRTEEEKSLILYCSVQRRILCQ